MENLKLLRVSGTSGFASKASKSASNSATAQWRWTRAATSDVDSAAAVFTGVWDPF